MLCLLGKSLSTESKTGVHKIKQWRAFSFCKSPLTPPNTFNSWFNCSISWSAIIAVKRKWVFFALKLLFSKNFHAFTNFCSAFVQYTLVLIVHNSARHEQKNKSSLLLTMQGEGPTGFAE